MTQPATHIATNVEAEITVSPNYNNTPMTTQAFIEHLRAQGFTGNVGTNPNNPGKIWFDFTA